MSKVKLPQSSVMAFIEALNGSKGELDAWLECNNEAEVRAHIQAAIAMEAAAPPAAPEECDMADDGGCPVCGEDGGTSCGMPNCGLLQGAAPVVPVAQRIPNSRGRHDYWDYGETYSADVTPENLYAAPVVPLTDEQIEACIHHVDEDGIGLFAFARAIEKAHGIGGGNG